MALKLYSATLSLRNLGGVDQSLAVCALRASQARLALLHLLPASPGVGPREHDGPIGFDRAADETPASCL